MFLSLFSVIAVSLVSFAGIALFLMNTRLMRQGLLYLVGFSTGAILGDVFLHMLPELAEDTTNFGNAMLIVLGGILFSFIIEKIIHWHHNHHLPGDDEHEHRHPVGVLCLVGDGIHNLIDGVLIAGSYLVSAELGIATTIAVILHEIPQEIGNYAVLIHSGFSRGSALGWNFVSGLTAVAGAVLVLFGSSMVGSLTEYLLPFAIGNLLYIAGSDLIPELHRQSRPKQSILQLLTMILGIAFMYAVLFLE